MVIVDQGVIIAQGSPQRLLHKHFDHKFVYVSRSNWPDNIALDCDWEVQGEEIMMKTPSVEHTLQQLLQQHVQLDTLRVRTPTLDDLFLKLTGHSLREAS